MASGLFGISMSSLLANQFGMSVTGQNIANVNTPGYSRQIPLFSTRDYGFMPGGVNIVGKQRIFDNFVLMDLRSSIASHNYLAAYFINAERLDSLFSNDVSDLSLMMQDFFSSLQDLNNDPASFQNREVFYNQMKMLVDRFHSMNDALDIEYYNFVENVDAVINEVNTILSSIRDTNIKLNGFEGDNSGLLDQRDELLEQLAKYLHFSVNERDDGMVDINIGKGNSLIFGAQSAALYVDATVGDFMEFDIKLKSNLEDMSVAEVLNGGQLGGLLAFRDEVLSISHAEIGRIAMSIADVLNTQNKLGMDLNSELGVAFFNDINEPAAMDRRVINSVDNTGTGKMSVGIDDMSKVTSSNYRIKIQGGNYTVIRKSDNEIVTAGAMGGVPFSVNIEGLEINFDSGNFNDGDEFLLTPTRYGANELTLLVNDLNKLALASPIRIMTDSGNTGDVHVIKTKVYDTTNASFVIPGQLNPPIQIEFLSSTTYQIIDATTSAVIEGPITYNSSIENNVFPTPGSFDPGYQITLLGLAQPGDKFTVEYNDHGTSDNRNGFELVQLQTKRLLNDSSTSWQQTYQQFANRIATKTHFADIGRETSKIVMEQSQERRDNISAVNIDEETANLIRFQQAYQAAANLLNVAGSMFDILLDAVMR